MKDKYPPFLKRTNPQSLVAPIVSPIKAPTYKRCCRCSGIININHRNVTNEIIKCRHCGFSNCFYFEVVLCPAPDIQEND